MKWSQEIHDLILSIERGIKIICMRRLEWVANNLFFVNYQLLLELLCY